MKTQTPEKLTVIFSDPSPVIHLNEPCQHRRVTIELTPEQQEALKVHAYSASPDAFEMPSVLLLEGYA